MPNPRTSQSLLSAKVKGALVLVLFSGQFWMVSHSGNTISGSGTKEKTSSAKQGAPSNTKAGTILVWKLSQQGDFMGDRILYISKDGYKTEYTKSNYTILMARPKWDVIFYNKTRKTIFTTTIEKSKKNFGLRSRIAKESFFPDKYKMEPGKGELVAGHKTDCVMCIGLKSKEQYGKTDVARAAYYMSNEIPMAPQVTDYFGQTWSNELCRRQSLRILVWTGAGLKKTKIETVKIEKVTVPGDFFQAPQGYTAVKSEDNVMLGNDLINDIVDDLGKQFGSHK